MTDKATKLRKLLMGPDILVLPGIYDALTAKIAEKVGFNVVVMGGYSIAAAKLAQPDVGYLSMTEMAEAVKVINNAIDLPVMADGDTGYGNALSVRRTVREYEQAGAAAIIFEDQVWPKRCGHMGGKEVIAPEEHEQKIRAAVEAKVNPATLIVARTDARSVLGLDNAIERGKRYLAAGAEALFIEAPQDERELERIGKTFPDAILIANMIEGGKTPGLTAGQLQALGFKIVFWPCTALYAVVHSLTAIFTELKETGTTKRYEDSMLNFSEFNQFVGLEKFQELEQKYKFGGGKNT
ncbi:2,3-dimethylmalate lyase [Sporomusa ovata DSM 2662]|nr:2,3-dimethylmalate lyase [Sporomusa ovata DSM 2662]